MLKEWWVRALLLAMAGFIGVVLILDLLGRCWPLFHPDVWGNGAEWASALLPTMAIAVTLALWHRDRRERQLGDERQLLRWVELDPPGGDQRYVRNASGVSLTDLTLSGVKICSELGHGCDLMLPSDSVFDEGLELIATGPSGARWRLVGEGRLPLRVDSDGAS